MTDDTSGASDRGTVIEGSNRRTFLRAMGGTAVTAAMADVAGADAGQTDAESGDSPADGRASSVPLTHGVASGEVTHESAVVWARAARESTLLVEYAPSESGARPRVARATVGAETDFTGQVRLEGLDSATRYDYRVAAVGGGAAAREERTGDGAAGSEAVDDGAPADAATDDGVPADAAADDGAPTDGAAGSDAAVEGGRRESGPGRGPAGAETPMADAAHFEDAIGGTFVTAPAPDEAGAVSFAWSGDTWGYGDDPIEPPYPGLAAIAEQQPDFFLYLGDTIYADAKTPAGKVTENTPLADALPIYRQKYREMRVPPTEVADRSNLLALLEATSVYSMWDDHEVLNNFAGPIEPLMPLGRRAFAEYWPLDRDRRRGWRGEGNAWRDGRGEQERDDAYAWSDERGGHGPGDGRDGPDWLADGEEGVRGWGERDDWDDSTDDVRLYGSFRWGEHVELFVLDTRQYRDPNVETDDKSLLGEEQLAWLKRSLAASDATWKVLASPAPLGHPSDSWATPADVTGYEDELRDVVEFVETEPISNVVAVAGDVHHSQVGAYDPDDDGEFEFHEAIAGPLGAPAGQPGDLYGPLNPTEFFARGGYANYGTVEVDEDGETLTIAIYDEDGTEQFSKAIEASEAEASPTPDRIESTFDDGTEGWLVSQNGGSNHPEYRSSGGNPDGHVSDAEGQGGVAWYYQAPMKFLGDREPFYGGTLSFDLRQAETDQQFDAEPTEGGDVLLRSGETRLVYEFRGPDSNPSAEWQTFEVPVTAEAGWINLDSRAALATEAELRAVLADLDALRVRGEYRSGADRSFLDNVVLARE